jgi:hypothetical protein
MTVSRDIFENKFNQFARFIKDVDGKPFSSFGTSDLIVHTENYKYSVYDEARKELAINNWKESDIGSGKIYRAVNSAVHSKVKFNGRMWDHNLVDWRKKDEFSKIANYGNLETDFFNFYRSKISDEQAFKNFITQKLKYQLIAYLFFIKDCKRYLPISQIKFDGIFEEFGITDFKTSRRLSWENYITFIDLISQIRKFLLDKVEMAALIDAHSFVWVFGNQMRHPERHRRKK